MTASHRDVDTLEAITGHPDRCPARAHQGSIHSIFNRLPVGYSASPVDLLEELTLYRFRAFFEGVPHEGALAFRATPNNYWGWVMPKLSDKVHLNVIHSYTKRKFCPQCISDDIVERGEPYWRNVHFIDEVVVCPWHACILENRCPICGNAVSYSQLVLPPAKCLNGHWFQPRHIPESPTRDAVTGIAQSCLKILQMNTRYLSKVARKRRDRNFVANVIDYLSPPVKCDYFNRTRYLEKIRSSFGAQETIINRYWLRKIGIEISSQLDDDELSSGLYWLHHGENCCLSNARAAVLLLLAIVPSLWMSLDLNVSDSYSRAYRGIARACTSV